MKKIVFILCLGFFLTFAPLTVLAANEVTFTADANFVVVGSGITVTVLSGATVDSITANTNDISVTVSSGGTITFRSDERRTFNVSPSPGTSTNCLNSSYSSLIITSATTQTFSVIPSPTSFCSQPLGGGGGGGGAAVVIPSSLSLKINNEAAETAVSKVTLQLSAQNASLMMVSNLANFSGVTVWQSYATSMSWQLLEGKGSRTVYAKFRSASGGESTVVSDSINLVEEGVKAPAEVSAPVLPTGVTEGDLVKEAGSPAVYLIKDGKKQPVPNGNIFEAQGYKWSAIKTVTDLSGYETGADVSYPPDFNFMDGMLVKGSNQKVYVISDGKRRWIENEAVFIGLGYSWLKVNVISDAKLAEYSEGDVVSSLAVHPNGTLVKYPDSPKVYVISGGKKCWITSEAAFNVNGYKWDYIMEISKKETYGDGVEIKTGIVFGVETSAVFVSDLKLGSVGEEVRLLQNKLKELGYFPVEVAVSGYFGLVTENAVKAFQDAKGIEPVGIVGPKTRAALNQ